MKSNKSKRKIIKKNTSQLNTDSSKPDPYNPQKSVEGTIYIDGKEYFKHLRTQIILCVILVLFSLVFDLPFLKLVGLMRNYYLTKFFSIITSFGDINYFFILLVIITIILVMQKKSFFVVWFAEATVFLVGITMKYITMRPRPFQLFYIESLIPVTSSSFPSNHALVFFALIPVLSKEFPKYKIFYWLIAILVGLSRIYLGVHYLSDVVAGAFLGYIIGYIFVYFGGRYGWR